MRSPKARHLDWIASEISDMMIVAQMPQMAQIRESQAILWMGSRCLKFEENYIQKLLGPEGLEIDEVA